MFRNERTNFKETGLINIKKCHLCGGKVVDGVCTDCGMKKSYSASKVHLNESSTSKQPKEHKEQNTKKNQTAEQKTVPPMPAPRSKAKKKSPVWTLLSLIILIMGISATLFDKHQENQREREAEAVIESLREIESSDAVVYADGEYDRYEYCEYDLPLTGDYYEVILSEGTYLVGEDIPEGTYRITAMSGYGGLNWEDDRNVIYEWFLISDEEWTENLIDPEELADLRFYSGAILDVEDEVQITFESDNAQMGEGIYMLGAE